ncbi:MAG: hypothetical protein H7Z10_03880 [Gemmatimonadaceae bacterium]|nr:hypothetical protein [Acetobacteraceae bacterium]
MKITMGCRLLVAVLVASTSPVLATAPADPCRAPDDVAGAVAALPKVAAVLKPRAVLDILAIGSATMFGPEATLAPGTVTMQSLGAGPAATEAKVFNKAASDRAFPMQMAAALRNAVPGMDVRVTVRGGRSLLATDMLRLMRAELEAKRYDLVLWQTGTVEAVRNVPPGEFGQTLSDGAEAVLASGANLVLVDPQYSRFLQTNSNVEPYEQGLQQIAAMPGVVLFRRYDLMRTWVNESQIDLERTPRAERDKVIETLHACLGKHLARFVLESARS